MEVLRLGVKLELLAYATATVVPLLSHICDLHHSSRQCWTHGLAKQTCILMDTSQIRFHCATVGTPHFPCM